MCVGRTRAATTALAHDEAVDLAERQGLQIPSAAFGQEQASRQHLAADRACGQAPFGHKPIAVVLDQRLRCGGLSRVGHHRSSHLRT